jgi:AraC family transcriptional regulator
VDDLTVDGHYIGIQLNPSPIDIMVRTEGDWQEISMPSQSMWLHPEGSPFSVRHAITSYWAGTVVSGAYLDKLMGGHYELKGSYVINDKQLSHLLLALVEQLADDHERRQMNGHLVESLVNAFVLTLANHHGKPAAGLDATGGISPHQLNALLSWVSNNIESDLTVKEMASRAGLSVAHFSREFKRSTGQTPWSHVVEQRLQLARNLLTNGIKSADVAQRCRFSDQSHLSRAIKKRFGLSPSELY